jgi:hypothetical protein
MFYGSQGTPKEVRAGGARAALSACTVRRQKSSETCDRRMRPGLRGRHGAVLTTRSEETSFLWNFRSKLERTRLVPACKSLLTNIKNPRRSARSEANLGMWSMPDSRNQTSSARSKECPHPHPAAKSSSIPSVAIADPKMPSRTSRHACVVCPLCG